MAARGYEFYLRVVKDTFSTKFLRKTQLFFYSFSKQQNSAIKVVPMWKFGSSSRKSSVTVPSSHLETILLMKFQENRPLA